MFSSFLQYLCLAPSFTNVLNVYAFCNLHDVSWGTKGSDKADALPSVSSSKGKNEEVAVVQDTERVQEDLDAVFKETVTRAVTKVEVKEAPEKPSLDDQNKTFRTRLVVFWMLSNAGLAVAIENINGLSTGNETTDENDLRKKQSFYFAIILYSTFGLAAVRFTGVCRFHFNLSFFVSRNCPIQVLVVLLQAQHFPVLQEIVERRVVAFSLLSKQLSTIPWTLL
jgi:chitin synthase